MSVRILFSVLRRHPMMPLLVLLQVALACAILCNVLFLTWQQLQPMLVPSGVDESNLILVDQLSPANGEWSAEQVRAGAAALREVPGVRAASAAISLPMEGVYFVLALQGPTGVKVGASGYSGYQLAHTLGIDIVKGHDFLHDAYSSNTGKNAISPIIITESLARQLFGNAPALGGILRSPDAHASGGWRVVGIVKHLQHNEFSTSANSRADDTVLLPSRPGNTGILQYAVWVDPHMRDIALRGVRKAIQRQFGTLLPVGSRARVEFYGTLRSNMFKTRRHSLWLLGSVALAILVVTMIGIAGLTGFWVQKRTRNIGIRRALGARRADILVHFHAENALIVGFGIVLGMLFAYLGNALLMRYYELPRLPLWYLPVGAAVLWLLGQLAVLGPALRAANVPPVVATRSV